MSDDFPREVFIKKADLCDGHMRHAGATFSGNCYVSVNPWSCFDMSDSIEYIKVDVFEKLETENAELKARLAHVENELKLEQEVVEFYGELDNWNTSYDDFAIDSDYEPFEVDDDGDSIYFGGKRARQRIKERKEFK